MTWTGFILLCYAVGVVIPWGRDKPLQSRAADPLTSTFAGLFILSFSGFILGVLVFGIGTFWN